MICALLTESFCPMEYKISISEVLLRCTDRRHWFLVVEHAVPCGCHNQFLASVKASDPDNIGIITEVASIGHFTCFRYVGMAFPFTSTSTISCSTVFQFNAGLKLHRVTFLAAFGSLLTCTSTFPVGSQPMAPYLPFLRDCKVKSAMCYSGPDAGSHKASIAECE